MQPETPTPPSLLGVVLFVDERRPAAGGPETRAFVRIGAGNELRVPCVGPARAA